MTILLLAIPVLILFSAFFACAETGIIGASRARIHKLRMEGDARAEKVRILREERQDHLIGALMLGNNLLNIAASTIATAVAVNLMGDKGLVYVTLIMTLLIVLFGELLPKSYALRNSVKVALAVAPAFIIIVKIFQPFTFIIQHVVDLLLRPFGRADSTMNGTDALRGAISLHHDEGAVVKDDRDMLTSILDLASVEVSDIMIHRKEVIMFDIDRPTGELIPEILASAHSRLPMWKGEPENIVGILHAKDLLKEIHEKNNLYEDLDIVRLVRDPWFIPENTILKDQLRNFRAKQAHFAIIVDEYGAFLGILTLEDILEEIVGQIDDEHDVVDKRIKPLQDGSYIIDGSLPLRDLNRDLDWQLPEDDASTLAGLVMHESQQIPDVNQVFVFHGVRFEILRKLRNQITSIKVRKLDA